MPEWVRDFLHGLGVMLLIDGGRIMTAVKGLRIRTSTSTLAPSLRHHRAVD